MLLNLAPSTAVERFSNRHDENRLPAGGRYRALLPAAAPGAGQQYAFEVDLDACTGCKACVTACNTMNGLDPGESWRNVGLLIGSTTAYQQTVTTGCHHCVEPGCMAGCPVDAYEKDAITGIVSHLDDQCIGCRYCTLTCPYEVPRFNQRLGIVRKCDLCAPRLAEGEAPACAQGCPNEAIRVTIVDTAAAPAWPIPQSPPPTLTRPTTVYRSDRPIPDAVPADHFEVRPSAGHTPLAVMLVLSQLAVGMYLAAPANPLGALATAVVALVASVAHLGRPHLAWKAVIGLRHSWVSREIVAFSAFTALTGAQAALSLSRDGVPVPLMIGAGAAGLAGVGCSVAIYAATGRRWWSTERLVVRFGLTTLSFALAFAGLRGERDAAFALAAVTIVRGAMALRTFAHRRRPTTELGRTALLLTGALAPVVKTRVALAALGGVVAPSLAATIGSVVVGVAGLLLLAAGEHLDRTLLFTASAAPRMPGGRR